MDIAILAAGPWSPFNRDWSKSLKIKVIVYLWQEVFGGSEL
jgi:hypothetical protein